MKVCVSFSFSVFQRVEVAADEMVCIGSEGYYVV